MGKSGIARWTVTVAAGSGVILWACGGWLAVAPMWRTTAYLCGAGRRCDECCMFRLTKVRETDHNDNKNGFLNGLKPVSLSDLIGSPDLIEMWQFNFAIDPDFVLSHMHKAARKTAQCNFVYGHKYGDAKLEVSHLGKNIHAHAVPLLNRFGTHHSKLMILFHQPFVDLTKSEAESEETGPEASVIVHTANLVHSDWDALTQMVWQSPVLTPGRKLGQRNQFQDQLVAYLNAYPFAIKELGTRLRGYDFSAVSDLFIASVPGHYFSNVKWGLPLLQQQLSTVNDSADLVIQVSSIGLLPANFISSFTKAVKCQNVKIVFPTVKDVQRSHRGYLSGLALHFGLKTQAARSQYLKIRPLLCKWRAGHTGRDRSLPHVKTYFGQNKNGHSKWFLMTSANLSKQAWGTSCASRKSFWIQSFECGVLRLGEQMEVYVPYDLPLEPYGKSDEIWSLQANHLEPDCLGQVCEAN